MEQSTIQGHYTVPEISIANSKDWLVYFRFTHEGKEYLRKYWDGMNRIKDKGERMAKAKTLRQEREDWLKMGWNPIIDPDFKLRQIKVKQGKVVIYLNDALDYALSKKSLKRKSKLGYASMLSIIKAVAEKTGASLLEITQVDRGICLDLIDECAKERGFSNHAYNKYTSCLRSMLSELLNRRIIMSNPLSDFQDKTVPESNEYASYTEEEKIRITKHLAHVHPQLFVVMSVVYHTGIRLLIFSLKYGICATGFAALMASRSKLDGIKNISSFNG